MKQYTVEVTYTIEAIDDDLEASEVAEAIETQRWQMFEKRFGILLLELKVET